nr:hypothetical protein [Thermoleophilaceae bacterium]
IALGGSSYAVSRIDGEQLKNRTVAGKKLKRDTLGGVTIKESRLGKVRRARRADRADTLQGFVPGQFKLRCPPDTKYVSGVCIERNPRPPAPYGVGRVECDSDNRRLASYQELAEIVDDSDIPFAPGGELAAEVYPPSSGDTPNALVVTTVGGGVSTTPDTFAGRRAFRCVAYPIN